MSKTTPGCIRLRGVRQNNLKNIDLDVPLGQLVVISGLSGSGKSSLAFETLFAEGQRRYIETFSPYARQFLDRMDKPQARSIEGIPPAIAIEQRNSVKSTRSTVGTMTEITDYAKLFWGHLARLHCRQCGRPVSRETPRQVWEAMRARADDEESLVTFALALSEKFSMEESLALVARQGFQRLLLDGRTARLDECLAALKASPPAQITVVQDRVSLKEAGRPRFAEACEQAYHFGQGKLTVHRLAPSGGAIVESIPFSSGLHCAVCNLDYREPSPALFSFNHPVGACPKCKGFGRVIAIDYQAAIPDLSKTLAGGAVKPWQTEYGAECQADMAKFAKLRRVPMNVPFREMTKRHQDWVLDGDVDYGKDKDHQWPRSWYGVKGYFRWLESKAYKMHVRVLLARYRRYETCPDCQGTRFQPDALLYTIPVPDGGGELGASRHCTREICQFPLPAQRGEGQGEGFVPSNGGSVKMHPAELTLPDFYRLSVRAALEFIVSLMAGLPKSKVSDPLRLPLEEVRSRLGFLDESGLGYLTLDRMTRSLSGGETERVNLTACLGSRLVNTLFVLDEPSVGLHARDTARLVRIARRLRDAGNTVVLVEHEAAVMRAADQIIDMGPGHGESGGRVVFQGPFQEILRAPNTLTGEYLSGKKRIEIPQRRPVTAATPALVLRGAGLHNLKNLTARFPLGRFVCVTGVSGSGKSTLVRAVLLPALEERLAAASSAPPAEEATETESDSQPDLPDAIPAAGTSLEGWENLDRMVAVDQSLLGRTPRSNPAVYIGAFEDIRALFAQTPAAARRGLNASAFSFNSAQGQCERCRGAGFEKIEMQFLSDVFVKCPDCQGRRYRPHILEVKAAAEGGSGWNIAELLEATVDEAVQFLSRFKEMRESQKVGRGSRRAILSRGDSADVGAGQEIRNALSRMASPSRAPTVAGPAGRALAALQLLQEVGLGYLRLGQPINTLSGGESQRLKLVGHLAEHKAVATGEAAGKPALFVFDEPTTGLHFDDVRVLLAVFQRLVDAGHSVLVIEHNLDVIKSADWVIDLGPEGGGEGGRIVAEGAPETIAATSESHTGKALASLVSAHAT